LNAAVMVLIIGMVMIAVALPIGLMITGNIYNVVSNMDLGSQGNQTRTSLFNNIYSAYNLSVILPIILVAGILMAVLGAFFTWGRQS